jgi:pimeloyl-ACP methyl ester carboxylesterase
MDWVFEHFFHWMKSLQLTEPAILIGHSLGGHVALEYARRVSAWTRGLILVNPFYSPSQLPYLVRKTYSRPRLSELLLGKVSEKWFRFLVDVSSTAIGHSIGALRALPERIREQTILDYKRVAPGVYHIPSAITDLTEHLHGVNTPTLVVWGDQDKTLAPASFPRLVNTLPKARGEMLRAGHVPHQSHAEQFNQLVLKFLKELP